MAVKNSFVKDPQSVLDYVFDWAALTNGTGESDWLASGETISTHTVTVDTGITKDSDELITDSTQVRVWLSGGDLGTIYRVTCRITTSAGRTDDRTVKIQVKGQ